MRPALARALDDAGPAPIIAKIHRDIYGSTVRGRCGTSSSVG